MSASFNTPKLEQWKDSAEVAEVVGVRRRGFWDLVASAMEFSGRMRETSNPYAQRALAEAWLRSLDGPTPRRESPAATAVPVRMAPPGSASPRRQEADTLAA